MRPATPPAAERVRSRRRHREQTAQIKANYLAAYEARKKHFDETLAREAEDFVLRIEQHMAWAKVQAEANRAFAKAMEEQRLAKMREEARRRHRSVEWLLLITSAMIMAWMLH